MTIVQQFLKAYVKSRLRGSTRIPAALAERSESLHSVPLKVNKWPVLYVDLRIGHAMEWFARSPWEHWPYNTDEQAIIRRFIVPGMTAVDVGVNLGLHLALMSHAVGSNGHVWGFEPNPSLTPNLIRAAVEMRNATIVPVALNEVAGPVKFFIPEDHMKGSMWDWTKSSNPSTQLTVPSLRFDDVGLGIVHFMKVDAEGAELEIFKGARSTLDRPDAPVILYEALSAFGRETFAATSYLTSLDAPAYSIFRLLSDGNLTPFDQQDGNLVAVPKSRSQS